MEEIVRSFGDSEYICFQDYIDIPRQIHMIPDMMCMMSLLEELECEDYVQVDATSNSIHTREILKEYRTKHLVCNGIFIESLAQDIQSRFYELHKNNTRIHIYDSLKDFVNRGFKTIEEAKLSAQESISSNTGLSARILEEIKTQTRPSKIRSWWALGISLIVPVITLINFCKECTQEKNPNSSIATQKSIPSNNDSFIIADSTDINSPIPISPNDSI